jgi:hypothetical protein
MLPSSLDVETEEPPEDNAVSDVMQDSYPQTQPGAS